MPQTAAATVETTRQYDEDASNVPAVDRNPPLDVPEMANNFAFGDFNTPTRQSEFGPFPAADVLSPVTTTTNIASVMLFCGSGDGRRAQQPTATTTTSSRVTQRPLNTDVRQDTTMDPDNDTRAKVRYF